MMPFRMPGRFVWRLLPLIPNSPFASMKEREEKGHPGEFYDLYTTFVSPLLLPPQESVDELIRDQHEGRGQANWQAKEQVRMKRSIEEGVYRYVFPSEMFEAIRKFGGWMAVQEALAHKEELDSMKYE